MTYVISELPPKNFLTSVKQLNLNHFIKRFFNSALKLQTYIFVTPIIQSYRKGYSRSNRYLSKLKMIIMHLSVGFSKKHFTEIFERQNFQRFDKGVMTGMILITLPNAFDKIHQAVHLRKLYVIGFSKHTVNLWLIKKTIFLNLYSHPAVYPRVLFWCHSVFNIFQ